MGLSTDASAALRSVVLIFIAHTFINSLLLTPFNHLRCMYWTQSKCTVDEDWIGNWLAFSHLHVAIVLGCMMVKAESQLVENVAYLCCTIIACYTMEGIFAIDLLDRSLSAVQCFIYVGILCSVAYITYEDPNSTKSLLQRPVLKKIKSISSFDQRQKLPIATIAVAMHLVSSLIRVIDMTYGNGRDGYKGDMSSVTYQAISNFAVCDMMLVCFMLLFALRFCETEQHKWILWGQAGILFISQVLLAGWQGEQMVSEMTMAGSIGTFVFVLIAIIGAL